jgi:hypothetical protein
MKLKRLVFLAGLVPLAALLVAADLWTVRIGDAPNDGQGDSLRVAFQKVNSNFAQVATWAPPSGLAGLIAWWDFDSDYRYESGYSPASSNVASPMLLESYNCSPDDDYPDRWTPDVAYNASPRPYMRSVQTLARPASFSVAVWWECVDVATGSGDLLWAHASLGSIGLTNSGAGLRSFFLINGELHLGGPIQGDSGQLIVWTYDGTTLRNYVNGAATVYCGDTDVSIPDAGADYVYFGDWLGTSYNSFQGYMYAASYWSRALTVAETQSLWNSGSGKHYPPW